MPEVSVVKYFYLIIVLTEAVAHKKTCVHYTAPHTTTNYLQTTKAWRPRHVNEVNHKPPEGCSYLITLYYSG